MAFEILVRYDTDNYTHPDPEKDERGVYKKGYPVLMKNLPHPGWGGEEGLPKFIKFRVTDANIADMEAWMSSTFGTGASLIGGWERKLDYEVVASDPVIDGFRLRVFALNPGLASASVPDGKAGINRDKVEAFINKWNGEVVTFGPNSVTFDVAVFEDGSNNPGALQSEGFWGFNPASLVFNELSYTQAGGIHQLEVDYSALPQVTAEQAERIITEKGGVIDNHVGSVVTFTMTRTDALDEFKKDVARAVEGTVFRRQFKVSDALADTVAGEGGLREVTLAQVQSYIENRADEDFG